MDFQNSSSLNERKGSGQSSKSFIARMKLMPETMSFSRSVAGKTKLSMDTNEFDFESLHKSQPGVLPEVFGEGLVLSDSETGSPTGSDQGSKVRT